MSKRLFVTNLSYDLKKEEFMDIFGPYGEISFINLVVDNLGKARGFGFVEFKDDNDAINAINDINGKFIKNRMIRVREANQRK